MAHQPSVRPAVPPPSQAASNAAAALQGANLAFARTTASRPIPPAKRVLPNGALYAAATASIRDRSRSRSPAPSQSRQTTGGTDGTTEHARRPRLASSPPPPARLSPSSAAKPTSYDTKSPSYIAAPLAASRSASPSPNANTPVPCLPVARRRTSVNSLSGASSLDLPDTSSIAPTTNLISMFERREDEDNGNGDDVEPMKKRTPVRRPTAMRRVPQLRAMTPEREISPQGRRTPPVRDPGSLATEETTPTARAKPRVKPKLRPMTPERKMSPDRREPGSPLRSELTPPSNPNPHVKARPGLAETEARPRPVETQAGEEAAAKPRAPSPPKPMRAVMAPLRLTQRHAPETRPPQPQKGQRVPDVSLRLGAPETATKADRSNGQALAAKSKPPPSLPPTLPPTPSSPKPVLVPKTRKHRPESIEMPPPRIISRSATAVLSPVPTRPASQAKLRPPTPPQPRGASSTAKPAAPPRATAPLPVNDANLAALSNGRRVSTIARPTTSGTSSSNETFVSASSTQTPRPASPIPRRELPPRPSSTTSMPVGSPTRPYTPSLPRRHPAAVSTSSLPLHSLSNAIMAGSLAAARLTPSNTSASGHSPAPPLPRRHHAKSPRLRQTLRQPAAQSDDEETRRKKKHHGSHSNKKHFHHEGARRRWREEMTPRERKRYEALWASNRGLLHDKMAPGPRAAAAADLVLNVVVREIWRRSRLPDDELGEVWDLVVGQSAGALPPGMLGKQEFVVGTWVVDQRLKGRKIPAKVGASVWDSAKGVRVWTPKAKEARRK
ncbi:hypothetical protein VD0003_g9165 [Verticillium dahliae]|nr:hypothetical protein VD0003_g9165 [Verticillium dahliae]